MANNESTMKWKVDVTQLKAAMQEAKRSINQANAEFKTATAGMDKWSKSSEGLEAKIKQLNKTLPAQKRQLEVLEEEYRQIVKTNGENSSAAHDLKIKIEEQKATIVKTETSISNYSDKLTVMKEKQAESETASGKLNQTIADQEDELKKLKKAYENAVIQYGENSDEAKELGKQIENLSGELNDNKNKLNDAKTAADKFDKSIEDTGKDAQDTSDGGLTSMKVALGNLVAEGINAAIDGLKNLATAAGEAWKEFDGGMDIIIAKTGATGDVAKELENVYKDVSKQVVGSFDEMGTAVGEVNTRFGVTGDDLEDLSIQFLKFAKLNGTNVNNSIDKVQSMMAAWGITTDKTGLELDLLNKAGQDTGVSVDQLADSLKNNAPALQEMGLSASDSAMFLANLDKNGLDAAGTMAGLKKALTNAAKEGKPMSTAMAEVEDSIKNAKTNTEAITIATELFGVKSGAAIATAVRSGKLSFKDLGTSMKDFKGNVETTFEATQDAPDKFALAVQGIRVDMAEMAGKLLEKYAPQIEKGLKMAKDAVETLFEWVDKFFTFMEKNGDKVLAVLTGIVTAFIAFKAITIVATVLGVFKTLFMTIKAGTGIMAAFNAVLGLNPIVLIIAAIAGLIAAFVVLWNKSEAFRNFWLDLWDSIVEKATDIWENYLKPIVDAIAEGLTWLWETVLQPVLQNIQDIFSTVFTAIQDFWNNILKPVFDAIGNVIMWLWNNVILPYLGLVKEYFSNVFSAIQGFWNNILKPVFEKIGEVFKFLWEKILSPYLGFIKDTFKNVFEGIKTIWNDILKPVFDKIGEVFKSLWNEKLKPTIKSIKEAFEKMGEAIGKVWKALWDDTLKPVINGILGGMETLANGVVKGMNKVIDALNNLSFTIPDWVPKFGGETFGFSIGKLKEVSLPRLFQGGILKRGQVGLLEGSGAEAVVPLEKNKQWIGAVVKELLQQMNLQGVKGVVGANVASLNGGSASVKNVTQNITFNQTNNSPKALNRLSVYRDTNNLLFSAKVRLGDV